MTYNPAHFFIVEWKSPHTPTHTHAVFGHDDHGSSTSSGSLLGATSRLRGRAPSASANPRACFDLATGDQRRHSGCCQVGLGVCTARVYEPPETMV